jgi:hypothetical protein
VHTGVGSHITGRAKKLERVVAFHFMMPTKLTSAPKLVWREGHKEKQSNPFTINLERKRYLPQMCAFLGTEWAVSG